MIDKSKHFPFLFNWQAKTGLMFALSFLIFFWPVLSWGEGNAQGSSQFIVCSGEEGEVCTFYHILELLNVVINYAIMTAGTIATIAIMVAGIYMVITPVSDKRAMAKGILYKAVYGFLIALMAFGLLKAAIVGLTSNQTEPGRELQERLQ